MKDFFEGLIGCLGPYIIIALICIICVKGFGCGRNNEQESETEKPATETIVLTEQQQIDSLKQRLSNAIRLKNKLDSIDRSVDSIIRKTFFSDFDTTNYINTNQRIIDSLKIELHLLYMDLDNRNRE